MVDIIKKLVAIAPTHCHLAELADAVQILTKSDMVELHGEAVKALLISTTSSDSLCLMNQFYSP